MHQRKAMLREARAFRKRRTKKRYTTDTDEESWHTSQVEKEDEAAKEEARSEHEQDEL